PAPRRGGGHPHADRPRHGPAHPRAGGQPVRLLVQLPAALRQDRGRAARPARVASPARQRVTNGGFTTVAGSGSPRPSMATTAPSATSGGRKASAMPWPSVGEKLPLVTSPTGSPSTRTRCPARGGRRPSVVSPRRRRATP